MDFTADNPQFVRRPSSSNSKRLFSSMIIEIGVPQEEGGFV
jgi:hypothetical protein